MSVAPATEPAGAVSRPESPYVGLVPYEEADAAFFFGRTAEAAIVAANLRAARLTILYGPSGVGKSSLLMAGAVHLLREEARVAEDDDRFAVCVYRSWRDDPLPALEDAARAAFEESAGGEALRDSRPTLAETLRAWTESAGTLLVVFDQFEEYFQYHPDDQVPTGFAAELARIVNDSTLEVNVLLSIREDALAKLDRFKGRIPSLFANYLRVDQLDLDAAREAIEGPITAWNRTLPPEAEPYSIESALTEAVLAASAGGGLALTAGAETPAAPVEAPGELVEAPFLQLVLERLWRATVANGEHMLTLAGLEALGGARRIVENHLLDALGRLAPAEQDTVSDCFRFLVSSGKTKIAHPPEDLAEWTQRSESEVTAVLDKLCSGDGGRILRAVAPARDEGRPTYELFHDVLAEPILAWRRGHEAERRRRAVRRRVIRIGSFLVALVAVFAALAVLALVERQNANGAAARSREDAAQANSLLFATPAESRVSSDLDQALLLALEANRFAGTAQARSAMTLALERARTSGLESIISSGSSYPIDTVAFSPDGKTLASGGSAVRLWDLASRQPGRHLTGSVGPGFGNEQEVNQVMRVAFSPDGGKVASLWSDGSLRLWDLTSGKPLERDLVEPSYGSDAAVRDVAFSADGATLASGGEDGKVRLWDLTSRKPIGTPLPDGGNVSSLAFSPRGKTLVLVGGDGKVQLRDLTLPKSVGAPLTGAAHVSTVAFSPDGETLATGARDGTVRLWDLASPRPRGALLPGGSGASVTSLAFGPHGEALASSDAKGSVRLWDAVSHEPGPRPVSLSGFGVAFSPDGKTLASGGGDGKVRLWNLESGNLLRPPLTIRSDVSVACVALSPDGKTLASGDKAGGVRLWSLASRKPLGPSLTSGGNVTISSVAFSGDGTMLAAGDKGGKVRLWDPDSRRLLLTLAAGGDNVTISSVAFSPDGKTLASGGSDGRVQLWDAASGKLLGTPVAAGDFGSAVSSVAFTPDGRELASGGQSFSGDTGGETGTVWLWDLESRQLHQVTTDHIPMAPNSVVSSLAFSPEGKTLATGEGNDANSGRVRLRDPSSPALLGPPLTGGGRGAVSSVAYSPDGKTLASGGVDGTVRLWDPATRKPLGEPLTVAGAGPFTSLAFSTDGNTLAGVGGDGTVRLWKGLFWSDYLDLRDQVCSLVWSDLSTAEWAQVAPPDLAYHVSCPR